MPASNRISRSDGLLSRYVAPLRADRPVLLSFLVFLLAAAVIAPLSIDYWRGDPTFLTNVLAEAHGMLMDLLVFGCLLLWFDRAAERRRRIERYRNAIEDFLGWETAEAMYRIAGNIRRLNREGAVPESLKNAFLEEADLNGADLSETSLNGASLERADLEHADLSRTYLGNANFTDANLRKADFSGAHFGVFAGMSSPDAGRHTTLAGANLRGADLRDVRNATAETFREAETLYKARLDPELEDDLEAQFPDLLEPRPAAGPGSD